MSKNKTPKLLCPAKVVGSSLNRSKVNRQEFHYLMKSWIEKAEQARDQYEQMNAFMYLWIPFNSWLAQIIADSSQSEYDRCLVASAATDVELSKYFARLISEDINFRSLATDFQMMWPIFKVRWLVEKGIEPWGIQKDDRGQTIDRVAYRNLCFSKKPEPEHYRPKCYKQHQGNDPLHSSLDSLRVPLDWAHALDAIYQIRCSLFHGGKTFANSRDGELAGLAFQILWRVWGEPQFA